jgi:hypothetical protein
VLRQLSVSLSFSLLSVSAYGQSPDLTIECRQWDDAFITNFYLGALIAGILALVLTLISGFIERLFPGPWMRRQPWYRAAWVFGAIFTIFATVLVLVPKWYLGAPIYSGVDPVYRECVTQPFGAAGLIGGRIGAGTAAYAQKPALVLIIFLVSAFATTLAWGLGRRRAAANMAPKE